MREPASLPPSLMTRSAKTRDASTYVGSFKSTKACCGVLERVGSTVHSSRYGAPSASLFNVLRIVKEQQSCLRRVGARSLDGAFLARWGVKRQQARMEEGALPVRVQAATVLVLVLVVHPFTHRKVEVAPV